MAAPKRSQKKAAQPKSRGLVDAPGKRHRKPPPQERGNPRMSEPKGSQSAPKIVQTMRRGGRG
jgi:hypothetical protein